MNKHLDWKRIGWTFGFFLFLAFIVSLVEFAFFGIEDIAVLLWTYPINILFVVVNIFILIISQEKDISEWWNDLKEQYYHNGENKK